MFLGSRVSASEQGGMSPVLIMFLGTDWIMCRLGKFYKMVRQ